MRLIALGLSVALAISGAVLGYYQHSQRLEAVEGASNQQAECLENFSTSLGPSRVAIDGFRQQQKALDNRISSLETHYATWQTEKSKWSAQLEAIRSELSSRASEDAVEGLVLEQRDLANAVADIRRRIAKPSNRAAQVVTPRKPTEKPPTSPPPPFRVLGIEGRSDQLFLLVSPPHKSTLTDVRLLGLGETIGGWTLKALRPNAATWSVKGYLDQVTHLEQR